MTEHVPKKRGPKPKTQPVEAANPVIDDAATDEDTQPEHAAPVAPEPRIHMPLIDGVDPAWAVSASIGSRHIQFTAHDDAKHADLIGMLSAGTVTIPGHAAPTVIASRTITPPKLRPVRVTFTVRERIEA